MMAGESAKAAVSADGREGRLFLGKIIFGSDAIKRQRYALLG